MRRIFCRVTLTNFLILLLILTLLFNLSILLQILSTLEVHSKEQLSTIENKPGSWKYSPEIKIGTKLTKFPFLLKEGFRPSVLPATTTTTKTTTESGSDIISVEALSGRREIHVSVNNKIVYQKFFKPRNYRGIHVVILNQIDGTVMSSRVFDVFSADQDELMLSYLKMIKPNRLFVFLVMDEGSYQLRKPARDYLASTFGSSFIKNLWYRDSWTLIAWKGQKLSEVCHKNLFLNKWGDPSTARTKITLKVAESEEECQWTQFETNEALKRRNFCHQFEGYETTCFCNNTESFDKPPPALPGNNIASTIPLSIIAGNRPHYLFRMLRGFLTTPGVNKDMVTVYIDGFFKDVAGVADLFGVKYVFHVPLCAGNCRISQHYKRSLKETFDKHPETDFMIILEEDLDVSSDLMDYFSQLIPVLDFDESLFCISAWNDQGYEHSSYDSAMLYRIETMPGLGWVLKRSIFNELYPKWPGIDKYWDWDMWMRMDTNRKGRECIIPDVSRTYHFGASGLNVDPNFQEIYFKTRRLNEKTGNLFDTAKVTKNGYEKEMNRVILNAEVLELNKTKCRSNEDFIVENKSSRNNSYVLYIEQKYHSDYDTWSNIAKCLKIWDLDVRGFHKQAWRLWANGKRLTVVGSNSPYYKHKPANIEPLYFPKIKT